MSDNKEIAATPAVEPVSESAALVETPAAPATTTTTTTEEKKPEPPAASEKPAPAPAAAAEKLVDHAGAGTSTATVTAAPSTPIAKLAARLPEIVKKSGHAEMWAVDLSVDDALKHAPTKVVLQKFLRANNGDPATAEKQLTSALEWRAKTQPGKLVDELYDEAKYGGLGYLTVHKDAQGKETIITWNIYGAVKDKKATFGNVQDFIKWRAALMEMGVQRLNLSSVTEAIPDDGPDPYQMIQVHDYLSVSFLRMDPHVKAASQETIQTFGMAYPELLSHKYFVNVPAIMGWMYAAMKLFLAPATLRKFHPMSSGTSLAGELPTIADTLPTEYGGKAGPVKDTGLTVKFAGAAPPAPASPADEAKPEPPAKDDTPAAGAGAGADADADAAAPPAELAATEAKAEEAKAEETKAEETKAEETKTEETKTEEPKTEEPKTEEPKTEEPKTEESKTEEEPKKDSA
ncbi:phosphatidylinositol transfer protein SFH5 [Geosmithia morbida]|uniref:Phosphatidylinositol transfer protein SFH5 n=1 Tax=Geosmithia morbida TaxID=1094350 RepID=A0A9P5D0X0_9HYPO|nr:phosphatidylinositol transfer protein SFH5 [Geosmithia morbida]KAF4119866.1 phosphatidylinositol transfer protein SFH5 [Geosmithia morbida]